MKRVFVDFHHSSLLRSLVLLFENRLGMDVYRPIGMDWFNDGFWAINNIPETAQQFLEFDSQPLDETAPLNFSSKPDMEKTGVYHIYDPGNVSVHKACTLEFFKTHQFDYLVASIPAHVPIFKRLIELYQPEAKLIVQMGNNWNLEDYAGMNVLASIAPQPTSANACFYHQEFDLNIFHPAPIGDEKNIYSFINCIEQMGVAWQDYRLLREAIAYQGFDMRAFGGQCPDGNMQGPVQLANKMREAMFVFHVKPGGDGFGHIIHNAYAVGRPIITRKSYYAGQLAEQLMVPGTFIDLDTMTIGEAKNQLIRLSYIPETLQAMGERAAEQFRKVVQYEQEADEVAQWLKELR